MRVLFDSSALFKRYQAEPGYEQFLEISSKAREYVVAAHCKAEIASALSRQRHDGYLNTGDYMRLLARIQSDFAEIQRIDLDRRVEAMAIAAMEKVRLRAMDALHIGCAQVAGVDLFVTADRRQALAARTLGLRTELIEGGP